VHFQGNYTFTDVNSNGIPDAYELRFFGIVSTNRTHQTDTDGDGIPDGVEVKGATDPLDAKSFNYASALSSLAIKPANFALNVNSIQPNVNIQLQVLGTFIGGFGTVDLTSQQRGTAYSSSDPTICNFGGTDGLIFAGNAGSCTITASVGGLTAAATGVVRNFTPTVLSEIPIPGFLNGIDVSGNFAYIAAGPTGLQVVNMQNRNAPVIVGSVTTPVNAEDVKVVGKYAYVADSTSGLQVIDVSIPGTPSVVAALSTPG